ncbi:MAG TPA: electron-transfer flavoprotein:ubiquinone oxidoreductase [Oligoflexia bacterium]|nr:electron-transfer flavoprotein:ubiquinone oxidoreductase [Oligoflexia bacterium]
MTDAIQREVLDVDFLFVGAGPASLAAAIRLAQNIKDHNEKNGTSLEPMIAVIEKAAELGGHQASGAVFNPQPLSELFPDFLEQNCPVEAPVTKESVYFLKEKSSIKFPIIPPQMHNKGNYVASLSKLTRWLGEKATELGINIFNGFTGNEVLYENNRVIGVRTKDQGINAKGEQKPNFEPGVDIKAKCVVFGEGVRGYLTKQLIPKLNLQNKQNPQVYETAVKEVWQCKPGTVKPGSVIHTMGYPLDRKTVGGTFIYGFKNDVLTIGLVVGLDYQNSHLEPYQELQRLKAHPLISKMIDGGKQLSYGAKAITAGGYYAMPQLYFDGGVLVGESGGLLDIAKLKGIHHGMRSGILAADQIFSLYKDEKDFTADHLAPYQEAYLKSKEGKDLYKARNFHQALAKGLPEAFLHIGMQQITGGRGLIDPMPAHLDRESYLPIAQSPAIDYSKKQHHVDKLTSVFNAGTIHEEDQPSHLIIGDTSICYDHCDDEYAAPCNRFCPANVYDLQKEGGHKKMVLNFTNCVHCQTCDINCPKDNISWTPPESGGGPRYENM